MRFELTEVWGFDHALRGMRNPKESWIRSDSWQSDFTDDGKGGFVIGANDMKLAQQLIRAGSEHRKFLRQVFVSVDISAPLYWWKEFDTYRIGITENSQSTMHKLSTTPITLDCFEIDDYDGNVWCGGDCEYPKVIGVEFEETFIGQLEFLRKKYIETKDKRYWKELIRWLPESWLQTRTVTMNYESIYSILRQRRNHKLTEWSESFINWCKTLPYADELLFIDLDKKGE